MSERCGGGVFIRCSYGVHIDQSAARALESSSRQKMKVLGQKIAKTDSKVRCGAWQEQHLGRLVDFCGQINCSHPYSHSVQVVKDSISCLYGVHTLKASHCMNSDLERCSDV